MPNVEQRTIEYLIKAVDQSRSGWDSFKRQMTTALSAAAIAKFTMDALNAADALEGVKNRAEMVFGSSFPKLTAETNKLAEAMRRSDSDIMSMQTELAGVLQGSGIAGKGVVDMTTKLSKLTLEFGNFFRVSDEEAFNLIQGALLGQTRALQRYGVVLNDTTMQEYLHAKGINKKFNELNQSEQVLQRYNFLLDKTKQIQEGGAKAVDSFSSRLKELKGKWNDLLEVIGTPVLPIVTKAMDGVIKFVQGVMAEIDRSMKEFANKAMREKAAASGNRTMIDSEGYVIQSYTEYGGATGSWAPPKLPTPEPSTDGEITLSNYGGGGGGGGGKSAAEKLQEQREKMSEELSTLREDYMKTRQSIKDSLVDLEIEHEDKMADIADNIKQVDEAITKLKDDYKNAVGDMTDTKFDKIVEQQKKVKDMQDELRRTYNEPGSLSKDQITNIIGSLQNPSEGITADDVMWLRLTSGAEKQVNLYLQLQKEQEALNKFLESNKDILKSPEFKEAEARSKETGFEKSMNDIQEQMDERQKAHEAELARLEAEKTKLEESKQKEMELYETRKQALNDTITDLDSFRDKWQENMQNINGVTETITTNLKKKLEELRETISSIDALMQRRADVTGGGTLTTKVKGRYGGGIVGEGETTIVGEDGPEIAKFPAGTRILTRTDSMREMGGKSVVVQGPLVGSVQVNNRSDVDMLMRELTRKIELISQSSS